MKPKSTAGTTSEGPASVPPIEAPNHEEDLLDQSGAESFPASDPIAPAVEQRSEPADVRNGQPARRLSALPLLIAFGTAAIVLLAVRALSRHR